MKTQYFIALIYLLVLFTDTSSTVTNVDDIKECARSPYYGLITRTKDMATDKYTTMVMGNRYKTLYMSIQDTQYLTIQQISTQVDNKYVVKNFYSIAALSSTNPYHSSTLVDNEQYLIHTFTFSPSAGVEELRFLRFKINSENFTMTFESSKQTTSTGASSINKRVIDSADVSQYLSNTIMFAGQLHGTSDVESAGVFLLNYQTFNITKHLYLKPSNTGNYQGIFGDIFISSKYFYLAGYLTDSSGNKYYFYQSQLVSKINDTTINPFIAPRNIKMGKIQSSVLMTPRIYAHTLATNEQEVFIYMYGTKIRISMHLYNSTTVSTVKEFGSPTNTISSVIHILKPRTVIASFIASLLVGYVYSTATTTYTEIVFLDLMNDLNQYKTQSVRAVSGVFDGKVLQMVMSYEFYVHYLFDYQAAKKMVLLPADYYHDSSSFTSPVIGSTELNTSLSDVTESDFAFNAVHSTLWSFDPIELSNITFAYSDPSLTQLTSAEQTFDIVQNYSFKWASQPTVINVPISSPTVDLSKFKICAPSTLQITQLHASNRTSITNSDFSYNVTSMKFTLLNTSMVNTWLDFISLSEYANSTGVHQLIRFMFYKDTDTNSTAKTLKVNAACKIALGTQCYVCQSTWKASALGDSNCYFYYEAGFFRLLLTLLFTFLALAYATLHWKNLVGPSMQYHMSTLVYYLQRLYMISILYASIPPNFMAFLKTFEFTHLTSNFFNFALIESHGLSTTSQLTTEESVQNQLLMGYVYKSDFNYFIFITYLFAVLIPLILITTLLYLLAKLLKVEICVRAASWVTRSVGIGTLLNLCSFLLVPSIFCLSMQIKLANSTKVSSILFTSICLVGTLFQNTRQILTQKVPPSKEVKPAKDQSIAQILFTGYNQQTLLLRNDYVFRSWWAMVVNKVLDLTVLTSWILILFPFRYIRYAQIITLVALQTIILFAHLKFRVFRDPLLLYARVFQEFLILAFYGILLAFIFTSTSSKSWFLYIAGIVAQLLIMVNVVVQIVLMILKVFQTIKHQKERVEIMDAVEVISKYNGNWEEALQKKIDGTIDQINPDDIANQDEDVDINIEGEGHDEAQDDTRTVLEKVKDINLDNQMKYMDRNTNPTDIALQSIQ